MLSTPSKLKIKHFIAKIGELKPIWTQNIITIFTSEKNIVWRNRAIFDIQISWLFMASIGYSFMLWNEVLHTAARHGKMSKIISI